MSKEGGNLTFVVVNKAGHMVPKDQLANSCAMLKRWISGSGWPHEDWSDWFTFKNFENLL